MQLTLPPLEINIPQQEDSYLTKENLEHLMMEHTRGWLICCLIAHDTFGSFMKAQMVQQAEASAPTAGIGLFVSA